MTGPRACALATAIMVLAASSAHAAASLEPYQMGRSLQLVQDRIAEGDHAALPMQRKLLELIDERLRQAAPEEFEDTRNFESLMIYAMSGGNPATLSHVGARLDLEGDRRALARGVAGYLSGNPGLARDALASVDTASLDPQLAAFVALIQGSVATAEEAGRAIAFFDRARLLGAGTLVEEAALRRALAIHVAQSDPERFLRAASQYVRRFLRSPYASQFAESVVAGIGAMHDRMDRGAIEELLSWMTREQTRTIYLRLARKAAIDGDDGLLDFASAQARRLGAEGGAPDSRSMLYSGIASVTSDDVEQVLAGLRRLDRSELSSADLFLLEAAERLAADIVARPGSAGAAPVAEVSADTDAFVATDAVISSARSKLEAIDTLLGEHRSE